FTSAAESVFLKLLQAVFDGLLFDGVQVWVLADQVANAVGDDQKLKHARAAVVASAAAVLADFRFLFAFGRLFRRVGWPIEMLDFIGGGNWVLRYILCLCLGVRSRVCGGRRAQCG